MVSTGICNVILRLSTFDRLVSFIIDRNWLRQQRTSPCMHVYTCTVYLHAFFYIYHLRMCAWWVSLTCSVAHFSKNTSNLMTVYWQTGEARRKGTASAAASELRSLFPATMIVTSPSEAHVSATGALTNGCHCREQCEEEPQYIRLNMASQLWLSTWSLNTVEQIVGK